MTALETEARKAKRTLLTLDTVTGGPAEALYRSLGYVAAGVIPGYSFNYNSRLLEPTTVMYKDLNAIESFIDPMERKGADDYGAFNSQGNSGSRPRDSRLPPTGF